jgi:uncharacterized protein YcbX
MERFSEQGGISFRKLRPCTRAVWATLSVQKADRPKRKQSHHRHQNQNTHGLLIYQMRCTTDSSATVDIANLWK